MAETEGADVIAQGEREEGGGTRIVFESRFVSAQTAESIGLTVTGQLLRRPRGGPWQIIEGRANQAQLREYVSKQPGHWRRIAGASMHTPHSAELRGHRPHDGAPLRGAV